MKGLRNMRLEVLKANIELLERKAQDYSDLGHEGVLHVFGRIDALGELREIFTSEVFNEWIAIPRVENKATYITSIPFSKALAKDYYKG